jgi:hypothetical protein
MNDYSKRFWVVDNFYHDPDEVRARALKAPYKGESAFYKGHRSLTVYKSDFLKKAFEDIIGKKITEWDYGMNGRFQYTTAEDRLVYHQDGQMYGGIIYLNPKAPYRCGTTFLASDNDHPYRGGNFDKTKFDVVDMVGNVYNRLLIFEGCKTIHAASEYFGTGLEDSRLIHLFFFDSE